MSSIIITHENHSSKREERSRATATLRGQTSKHVPFVDRVPHQQIIATPPHCSLFRIDRDNRSVSGTVVVYFASQLSRYTGCYMTCAARPEKAIRPFVVLPKAVSPSRVHHLRGRAVVDGDHPERRQYPRTKVQNNTASGIRHITRSGQQS